MRAVVLVVGILLTTLGGTMVLPAIIDLTQNNDDWIVFAASAGFTLFVGISMILICRGRTENLTVKQAFVLTTLSWLALVTFAAIPFSLSDLGLSYTDAFFEAMSGLTTTGATVITGLDLAPPGILIWRALLQWLGGIGIIVMAVAVLPMLQVGGMQLFRMESSDTSEKILPRASQLAGSITLIYLAATIACMLGYYAAGMRLFDALAHAMTTISTGGYSTHDASISFFDSAAIDMVAVLFMIVGSVPFVLYLQAVRGRLRPLLFDSQVRWFLIGAAVLVALAWIYQVAAGIDEAWPALRNSAFNIVSVITTTGYANANYGDWGTFAMMLFFCVMFIGGCAGSTAGGIKIFRFQVLAANVSAYISRLVYPHGVFEPRYQGRLLRDDVSAMVMSFFFLFLLCFAAVALVLNLIGLDNVTALSAAASAMANVGPGLGDIVGPAGTYAPLPDLAKWVLSAAMLLGRLELFTVLVLLTPAFWRA